MAKSLSKKLILATVALVAALAFACAAVFAWIVMDGDRSLLITNGDSDIEAALYLGNDDNRDGVLETNNATVEDSRSGRISAYYTELDVESLTMHDNLLVGESITFKAVVINPNTAEYDVTVSISFSALIQYIVDAVPADQNIPDSFANDIFTDHSMRLLFTLENIGANVYTGADGDGFAAGYNTLLADRAVAFADKSLWEVSAGERFAEIRLCPGELLEIDFKLVYIQLTEERAQDYSVFAATNLTDYLLASFGGDAQKTAAFIQAFISAELLYLRDALYTEGILTDKLVLEKIYITGTQLAESAV